MTPLFFIEGKVRPCLERSGFFHSRYDEAEVFDDVLIFVCSTPSRDLLWLHHRVIIMVGRWLSEFVCHYSDEV